ncbi:lactate racemase domain-containing protein [Marispirochaeta sp.]|uniref:lactate racemase domain-containing protein n=1 Tax=Marispirochaeta sp. TaxID=2038653 RepID=UPI0029C67FFA|nr:lactate racemase domain-containing protein [Marispirochaeta sp.]
MDFMGSNPPTKTALNNKSVARIISKQKIPRFYRIQQNFDDYCMQDIPKAVVSALERPDTFDCIKPGQRIALTAGSRGVCNIVEILKTVADQIKKKSAQPFIIPAMGSHGGATAEGQTAVLESYGISEESTGCPVLSSMETVQIGIAGNGKPVRIDKIASEADGIILVGRVKAHTAFSGNIESGLLKMAVIGLGKQFGAEICHADGFGEMEDNICSIAKVIFDSGKISFGIALIENAYDKTRRISAIPTNRIFAEEPEMLLEAKKHMPSILLNPVDVLVVDAIGKNISGSGMDPNISGTFSTPYISGGLEKQRVVVLDITKESHGNGLGMGAADFSVQRAYDKFDFEMTYPNALTSTVIRPVKIPMILANDRLAIAAAIKTCNMINFDNPRVVRIKNTLEIREIMISEALYAEAEVHPQIKIIGGPEKLKFDVWGNLF